MRLIWHADAWDEYTEWQHTDKTIVKRINTLIRDILRNPTEGLGKPEQLKFDLTGMWSRRINEKHRLIYTFDVDSVAVISCVSHYGE